MLVFRLVRDCCTLVCRLRTSLQLWSQPEVELNATADCYVFSRGPDVLVLLTNRGSSQQVSAETCSVQLTASGSQSLLQGGLSNICDVLSDSKVSGIIPL